MIQRISYYGGRRVEDFDKYEALRYAEELASVAKSSSHPKAASYDVIASTLREKLHVPAEQFKAYFLALVADKDFSRVIETISKVDNSFQRSTPFRTQTRRGRLPYQQPYFQAYQRHPFALFVTNVVNQGISHPSVGSALLLVSLLLLLSLDLTLLQHNFVVSSYAIRIFL